MTHRERVITAIKHGMPDRVPAHTILIDDPEPYLKYLGLKSSTELMEYLGMDITVVSTWYKEEYKEGAPFWHFGTSGGAVDYSASTTVRPFEAFETVDQIEKHDWPDVNVWDYDGLKNHLENWQTTQAIMVGSWNPIFDQVLDFFGMETAMINMHLNPELIEATVAHVEDYYMNYYRKLFSAATGRAQIFNMGDDFATQRGMLISPEHWRKFIKPSYKKIFDLAKSHGLYVWFHSCGAISEVLPDLIEIGMDVWETVQAHLPGNEPERLKREFGKDISFFGAINTQSTLPYGTPEDVRREVRERIRVFGRNGGYICGPDHHIKVDVPIENTLALYDEIINFREKGCTL